MAGRVSQLWRELYEGWPSFVGEGWPAHAQL